MGFARSRTKLTRTVMLQECVTIRDFTGGIGKTRVYLLIREDSRNIVTWSRDRVIIHYAMDEKKPERDDDRPYSYLDETETDRT